MLKKVIPFSNLILGLFGLGTGTPPKHGFRSNFLDPSNETRFSGSFNIFSKEMHTRRGGHVVQISEFPRLYRFGVSTRSVVLLTAFSFFLCLPQRSVSQAADASTVQRDDASIATLQRALQVLGGSEVWEKAASVRLRWSIKDTPQSEPRIVVTKYLWTNDVLRTRTEFTTGGKTTIRFFDPDYGASISQDGNVEDLKGKARVIDLPRDVPAVAFLIALKNLGDYLIREIPPSSEGSTKGISVTHIVNNVPDPSSEQDWYFSEADGLPTQVIVRVRDLRHGGRLLRVTTQFTAYQSEGALEVAKSLVTKDYTGRSTQKELANIDLGHHLENSDFHPGQGGGSK